jgi:hypothetical protein
MPLTKNKPSAPPKTKQTAIAAEIKSIVRNTLLASPDFPRLYADVVISSAPNSNEAKLLARNYQKIVDSTNTESTNLNRTNMPKHTSIKICTHIKVTGVRCGSPALRGEQFCYFHQRMLRTVKGPPDARLHHVALLENEEAIQASLMEVVNALLRKTIEVPRAELVLRALNAAIRNAGRVRFGRTSQVVTTIPNYSAPPPTPAPPEEKPIDLRAYMAEYREENRANAAKATAAAVNSSDAKTVNGKTADAKTIHVGTDAQASHEPGRTVRPAGPDVPGRSDPSTKKNAAIDPSQRKPPESVREPAPKERKITAHPVRGG